MKFNRPSFQIHLRSMNHQMIHFQSHYFKRCEQVYVLTSTYPWMQPDSTQEKDSSYLYNLLSNTHVSPYEPILLIRITPITLCCFEIGSYQLSIFLSAIRCSQQRLTFLIILLLPQVALRFGSLKAKTINLLNKRNLYMGLHVFARHCQSFLLLLYTFPNSLHLSKLKNQCHCPRAAFFFLDFLPKNFRLYLYGF